MPVHRAKWLTTEACPTAEPLQETPSCLVLFTLMLHCLPLPRTCYDLLVFNTVRTSASTTKRW